MKFDKPQVIVLAGRLLIAAGNRQNVVEVHDSLLYKSFLREYGDEW
jgi:hypothetical protein